MNLDEMSPEDLRKLADEKEQELREKARPQKIPLHKMNMGKLIEITENFVGSIVDGDYHEDSDLEHYIFEETMKTIYGENFFDWFNKNV